MIRPSAWDDTGPKKTAPGFGYQPGTSYGRELINMNFKIHYNWIESAGSSVDAQVAGPVKRFLRFAKKNESWKPSLNKRYNKQVQDQWMESMVQKAKPGVDMRLPEHIIRYKEYRKKNKTLGVNWVERYEYMQEHEHHQRLLRNIKPATNSSPSEHTRTAASFMENQRFTRGGMDKHRPQSQPGSMRPRLGLTKTRQRPQSQPGSMRPSRSYSSKPQIIKIKSPKIRSPKAMSPDSCANLPISSALCSTDLEEQAPDTHNVLAAKLAAHRTWREISRTTTQEPNEKP